MTVNALLTVQRDAEYAADKYGHKEHAMNVAYQLGWTQSAFSAVLNQIAAHYGENDLLKILDRVNVMPMFGSTD